MYTISYIVSPGGSKKDMYFFSQAAPRAGINVIIYSLKPRLFILDVIFYNFFLVLKLKSEPIIVFERRDLLFLILFKLLRKNIIIFRSGTTSELSLKCSNFFLFIPNIIIAVSQKHKREFQMSGFNCETAFPAFCKEPSYFEELTEHLSETGNSKYLFFAGKLCANKGVCELIEFCIRMKLHLKIAGFKDVNENNYYNEVVRLSGSSDYICFLGELSEENVIEEIKCSSAYISNSSREGFPLTFLYALQNGVPIITKQYLLFPDELKLPFVFLFDDLSELAKTDLFEWANGQDKQLIKESYSSNFSNIIKLRKIQDICQKFQ